jgi:predicted alpha/beta-fold hydrolase
MGTQCNNIFKQHFEILAPHLLSQGINVDKFQENFRKPTLSDYDHHITGPLAGYKSSADYYATCSCSH